MQRIYIAPITTINPMYQTQQISLSIPTLSSPATLILNRPNANGYLQSKYIR